MPFVAAEFLRLCATLGLLVVGMLVLKKNSLDLGPLMGGSCGGGFLMGEDEDLEDLQGLEANRPHLIA